MTYDQAQSPRLGQRVPVESTFVRMFSGDEIPEAAWPGQIIYRNEEQILQIYNGESWENVTAGITGQLTFVGDSPPIAQHEGDIWFNTADNNRMYVAHSVGADQIVQGEWELVSSAPPPITPQTHIYQQSTPPGALDIPPPHDNDFWFETPGNKQYYYLSTAPGNHWIAVRDSGIQQALTDAATAAANAAIAQSTANTANSAANTAIANAGTAQSTADGKVRSFFQNEPPTGMLAGDVGDMWFDTNEGNKLYQWTGSAWVVAQDQAIATALNNASVANTAAGNAQITANGKITTWYQPGIPTSTSIGDLWVDTDDGNKLYRAAIIGANTIAAGKWVSIQDSGIAAAATAASSANTLAQQAMTAAEQAQATADGAVTTYYDANAPWPNGTTGKADNAGDMWFDTDDNQSYRWNDNTKVWVLITDTTANAALAAAQNAQTTADGKITAWYSPAAPWTAGLTTHDLDFGDIWYDTDNKNEPWYWGSNRQWNSIRDGTIADAATLANTKIKTFYANGWVGDPPVRVGPVASTIGDIWYQLDDFNHMFVWNGTVWVSVKDGTIQQAIDSAGENYGGIADLEASVHELSLLTQSIDNTADTADGRVSMSDYNPGKDDVTYPVMKPDPVTGLDVEVLVPRVNGSVWFTRTRPRRNLCTNPSVETTTTGWAAQGAVLLRETSTYVPAGAYTLRITNSAVGAEAHTIAWGEADKVTCKEGQTWTASAYAELVSGVCNDVTMNIHWCDAAGNVLSTSSGTPKNLVLGSFNPLVEADPRLSVTAPVPTGAVLCYFRVIVPAAHTNSVWHVGAAVLEQQDDLGRYFDGDSEDGHWDGTAHASSSYLTGDKIDQIYELRDGDWVQKLFTDDAINDLNAAKLFGTVSGGIIAAASLHPSKLSATMVQASEALTAGDIVNVYSLYGDGRTRKASAAVGQRYEAHGYVRDTVPSGTLVAVYHTGYNTLMSGLTPGNQWLSVTPGKTQAQPPIVTGQLVQRVGHSPVNSVLNFAAAPPVWIM